LLAHGRWFSPASSTTITGGHDIAEILFKLALREKKNNESKSDNKLMAQDTQKYENTIYGPLWSFFSKMDEIDSIFKTRLYFVSRIIMFSFVNYKKWCTLLAAASDKVYQLLAHGRWFSPASSTTITGGHDIAEILLKVALKHNKLK
jgi:hypothetical protein